MLDGGGDRFLLAPGAPATAFFRGSDIKGSNSGQYGAQIRFRFPGGDTEYGLYAIRYNDKTPQIYIQPFPVPGAGFDPSIGMVGNYRLVYPEGIKTYGASFSTVVGDANVAGEVDRKSTRLNSSH